MNKRVFSIALAWGGVALLGHAQWVHQRDSRIPRTREGKANLEAAAPKMNGKPDLSGIWETDSSPRKELEPYLLPGGENGLGEIDINKHFANAFADYKFGEEPFQPGLGAQFMKALQSGARPGTLCPPPSVPLADITPEPHKVVQMPGLVLILSESNMTFRQIFTDGRKPPADPQPSWLGNSVGRWEGDTLVVETTGLNALSPLDAMGHPHSETLHVTERFRRVNFGRMELAITVDDPKTYTKPVTYKAGWHLLPDTDLIENFCEAETDLKHIGH